MEIPVIDLSGQAVERLPVPDALFAREYNETLVHQLVTAYLANARAGTRAQKTRAEVSKSTRKPWRQKGTGRARAGMASSPLWRGGGRTFPNSPDENFSQKVNRKMYKAGIASILSELLRTERVAVIESFSLDAPRTKLLVEKFKHYQGAKILLITDALDENLWLASRNLRMVAVCMPHQMNPVDLVQFDKVLITRGAVNEIQEALQ